VNYLAEYGTPRILGTCFHRNKLSIQTTMPTKEKIDRTVYGNGGTRSREDILAEREAIRRVTEYYSATPERATAYLIRLGYLTKSGKLSKRYGG
jgi:hypothetical protein